MALVGEGSGPTTGKEQERDGIPSFSRRERKKDRKKGGEFEDGRPRDPDGRTDEEKERNAELWMAQRRDGVGEGRNGNRNIWVFRPRFSGRSSVRDTLPGKIQAMSRPARDRLPPLRLVPTFHPPRLIPPALSFPPRTRRRGPGPPPPRQADPLPFRPLLSPSFLPDPSHSRARTFAPAGGV